MKILWQKKKSSRVVQEQLTLSLLSFVWGDSYWTPSLFFFIMTVPIILGCLDVPLFVEHDHSKQEELWVEWKSTDESCNRLPVHSEERALVKDAPLQLYAKHVLENTMADKKKILTTMEPQLVANNKERGPVLRRITLIWSTKSTGHPISLQECTKRYTLMLLTGDVLWR